MTTNPQYNRRIYLIINSVGLSCLGAAIFLQILVFSNILTQGYFKAVESNPTILTLEMALTVFSVIYFVYIYQKMIRTGLKP